MKKLLLLLPALLLLITSCSSDSDELITDNSLTTQSSVMTVATTAIRNPGGCFPGLTAHVYNTGTLSNPVISFIADVSEDSGSNTLCKITVELQATDCEDINSGYGSPLIYQNPVVFSSPKINAPHIELQPSQMLPCYRWRVHVQACTPKNVVICASSTQWYDAPIL